MTLLRILKLKAKYFDNPLLAITWKLGICLCPGCQGSGRVHDWPSGKKTCGLCLGKRLLSPERDQFLRNELAEAGRR